MNDVGDRSQCGFGLADRLLHGSKVGDVHGQAKRGSTELRGKCGRRILDPGGLVPQGDAAPLTRETAGTRPSDAAGSAGDDHDSSTEFQIHPTFPFPGGPASTGRLGSTLLGSPVTRLFGQYSRLFRIAVRWLTFLITRTSALHLNQ